jgi:hypothetical protein
MAAHASDKTIGIVLSTNPTLVGYFIFNVKTVNNYWQQLAIFSLT